MNEKASIQPGRYRHFKGNEYTVVGTAQHSETLEELVVYRQEYGEHGLWVRPKEMFCETVMVDGRDVPRFQLVGPSSEQGGESIKNIFDDLPQHLPKELVQILIRAADVRIERIISHGHASLEGFWYDQPQHEWVIVLKGAARLQLEDGMVEMRPGDFINIRLTRSTGSIGRRRTSLPCGWAFGMGRPNHATTAADVSWKIKAIVEIAIYLDEKPVLPDMPLATDNERR